VLLLGLAPKETASKGKSKPNIVVILADDLGWGSLNSYGADPKLVRTPHCDRLAREGRRFTDANAPEWVRLIMALEKLDTSLPLLKQRG
jgi:hypothetical protein